MFEITGDDIAMLNEEDLRFLVARLCESELRTRGFPISAVTWGGHQNAVDAGLDVRVALSANAEIDGFIPRRHTGFQVKKPAMPREQILKEMRPRDSIRPIIRDLAAKGGAYVIVSSSASTSDLALRQRRKAMAEALRDVEDADALALDFYDRTRLATWVRDHAGLILWVKERTGKAVQGWRSYGPWAYAPDGINGEYLLDNAIRVHTHNYESGISASEGIERVRALLRTSRGVVRLVGLSGVGKTRFAQALFDNRVGQESLGPSLAIYTNVADDPSPQPIGLASDLIATQTRAILVVDNCTPELHKRLSEVCRGPESNLSVLTIEYDIREDQPEGTEVFELKPSSDELIERLLKRRFPSLSAVDTTTIARFSGGNARIAIALAATVKQNETIAGLKDEELFRRLFQQRHETDEGLLLIGQACSLVYSFNGEDVSDAPGAELKSLGRLIGKTVPEMFRGVAELRRRDLVQQRGVWRAVLPQAVANRLAATALENIPRIVISTELIAAAPERLLTSFSRRLGYIHFSAEAQAIVSEWLAEGGRLGNLAVLDNVGKAMFSNIAAVIPDATLSVFERAFCEAQTEQEIQKYADYVHLLRSLAYEPELFERAANLIAKIAEHSGDGNHSNQARDLFASLFFVYLSGTRATIEQRLVVTEKLLASGNPKERKLGLAALKAALQTAHFSSFYNFEFGARSRDHGLWPRTQAELKRWFSATLRLAHRVACSETSAAANVRAVLADSFRGLWTNARVHTELEEVCRAVSGKQFWPGGWVAIRVTQHYDSKGLPPDVSDKLKALEQILRPTDLVQKVRSFVLPDRGAAIDLAIDNDDTFDIHARLQELEAAAESLGREIAFDDQAFSQLIPELVTSSGRLWSLGSGLAQATERAPAVWERLVAQLSVTPEHERQMDVFSGLLQGLRIKNPELVEILLDHALENEPLASRYPLLQARAGVNKRGVDRLLRSLALAKAPIEIYRQLAWGRASECISAKDLSRLLRQIAIQPDGFDVAVEILFMRLHSDRDRKQESPRELVEAGRYLVRRIKFMKRNDRSDYHLAEIVKVCLSASTGAPLVTQICRKLKTTILRYQAHMYGYDDLVRALATVHPRAMLDGFFVEQKRAVAARLLAEFDWLRTNPFDAIPENELLDWCKEEPEARYALAAAIVTFATAPDSSGRRHWSSVALQLLKHAPDRISVLKEFVAQFTPMSWSGSLAAAMEPNLKLLDDLETYPDDKLAAVVAQHRIQLSQFIERERLREAAEDKQRDERFE